jgi:hypothetical protein
MTTPPQRDSDLRHTVSRLIRAKEAAARKQAHNEGGVALPGDTAATLMC